MSRNFLAIVVLCAVPWPVDCELSLAQSESAKSTQNAAQLDQWPQLFRAEISTPGGVIYFGWELTQKLPADLSVNASSQSYRGYWVNGSERIEIPSIVVSGQWPSQSATIRCDIPHYQSEIQATWEPRQQKWLGNFRKRLAGDQKYNELEFHAAPIESFSDLYPVSAAHADPVDISGNWQVAFSSAKSPAVGKFTVAGNRITGTFLTDTGDYRFLSGYWWENEWIFGCFDGAHAFLFRARLQPDGRVAGDFWSGHRWHETWSATSDENAALPDPFQQSHWNPQVKLDDLKFADLMGTPRKLSENEFAGEVRLVQLFGSWCPNCHDAAHFLGELYREQNAGLAADQTRRLSIVGLAFELSGNKAEDVAAVQKYLERHQIQYPILMAGHSDKELATRELGGLDQIKAFPTTLFFDQYGKCRAVYSGFSGTATGAAYERLQQAFRAKIEEIAKSIR